MAFLQYTELEAVNLILRNMGEVSINSLINPPLDASEALKTLEEVSFDVQKRGWYFNTETMTLSPDHNGNILLPSNLLHVETVASSRGIPVTVRDGKLYRLTPFNNGNTFEGPVAVKLILGLAYNELPASARSYIALRAARVVQVRTVGDAMTADEDNRDETMALAELKAEQLAASKLTLTNALSVSSVLSSAYSPLVLR